MKEVFFTVIHSNEFIIIFKLFLIFVLSGFIGLERAALSKPAGFRTHVLVGLSAVLTMLCGEYLHEKNGGDITRISAQLLSGIGFLGAGTILRDGFNVKGLTTAASLLAVTCIGLCIGAGLYIAGIISTLMVYFILSHSDVISDKVSHYNDFSLSIETNDAKKIIEKVQKLLDKSKIEIKDISIEEDNKLEILKVSGRYRDEINKNNVLSKLMEIEEVTKVLEI